MLKKETKTVSVVLDLDFYNKVKEYADKEERNFSYVVRKALQDYLDKKEK